MDQRDYIRWLLEAYRTTPGTCGVVRRPERLLAAQLDERGVPIEAVENALVLAAVWLWRVPPPLSVIRSLAYFLPVIKEAQTFTVCPEYFHYLPSRA